MALLSVTQILQFHLQILLVHLETCWVCNLFPRTTRSPVAVLQAPQNNDTQCHTTLSMRKKIDAHKEPKIPKSELLWLVSAKSGTEQTSSWSCLLTPELLLSGQVLVYFSGHWHREICPTTGLSWHISSCSGSLKTRTPFVRILLGWCIPTEAHLSRSWKGQWLVHLTLAVVPHPSSDHEEMLSLGW